ncbi:MAG: hypothetical protein Unbinned664contig1000_63 [Prokaryotic dsDNA virus sp.]|nr:MAG: hypothetical protein Unbinned664contig1000_63 [Prokaryotic dsDNA virus sp.]|tara:strand:- start:15050 stop:15559 length:510 start_codon:yes stop_codon:yes gene_type:complete
MTNFDTNSGAVISECGKYRYRLWRIWDQNKPKVGFCMLNPSTADASVDDPTIRRLIGFAKAWGYGGFYVVNLFALRSPKPVLLKTAADPIGPDNSKHISEVAGLVDVMVCAWGNHGHFVMADKLAMACMHGLTSTQALHINDDGSPKHPLYIKGDAKPIPFSMGDASCS